MFEYSIIVILLFIIHIEGLRWKSTGYGKNSDNIISLKLTSNGPIIDVYDGKQIIILKDIDVYKFAITIHCYAVGYDNKSIEHKFCKNKICFENNEKHENKEFYIIDNTVKINSYRGIQININFQEKDKDYSANYHCEAYDKTNYFSIQSNFIQIRDKNYWEQHLVKNPRNEKTIHSKTFYKDDLPIKLPCFTNNTEFPVNKPKWIFQEFVSPVKWSVCPVKLHRINIKDQTTFTLCKDYTSKIWNDQDDTIMPRKIDKMKHKWSYYVNNNGELMIFDYITTAPFNISYAFMCYVTKNDVDLPINTHVSDFNGDIILRGLEFSRSNLTQKRTTSNLSSLHQNIKIPARNKKQRNVAEEILFAIYSNQSHLSIKNFKWYLNNKEIGNDGNFDIDKFKIAFLNEIKFEEEGNYSLLDDRNKMIFTISVTVDGPPSMIETNCIPPIKYLWENSEMSMRCRFNYRPTYFLIKISSLKFKEDTGTSYFETEQIPIIKNSENVMLMHDSNITSDHSITFIASNSYGSFARSSTIYFVPKLETQLNDYPSDFSCNKTCSNSESHKIFCRINKDIYLKKELDVNISWIINGRGSQSKYYQRILEKYFLLDPISNDLELKPITSEDKCGKSLKKFRIECQIILKFNDKFISKFFYNSSSDPYLQEKLTAIIKFDDPKVELKTFSLLWILPIIFIIIFISVIIFIIVRIKIRINKLKVTFSERNHE